jgi:tellurite resistance protein
MLEIIGPAIEDLCAAFERGGYNPTPVIDLGVLIANADGTVDERERELLLEVFQALLETKLTPEVLDHVVSASLEVIEVAGAEARARLVAAILQDCDAVEPGLRVALAIAFASEGLSDAERGVIDRIAKAAGVPKRRVDELVDEVRKHAPEGGPEGARRTIVPRLPEP